MARDETSKGLEHMAFNESVYDFSPENMSRTSIELSEVAHSPLLSVFVNLKGGLGKASIKKIKLTAEVNVAPLIWSYLQFFTRNPNLRSKNAKFYSQEGKI